MFKKVISKQCDNPLCKARGVIVDTALNLCEDCGDELTANTITDRRKLVPAVALTTVLLAGGGYLGTLSLQRYLAARFTQTTLNLTEAARTQIEAQIKDLLRQAITNPSQATSLETQIESLAKQAQISAEKLAEWRRQAVPATPPPFTAEAAATFDKLVRQIYRDGIKTEEEQKQLVEWTQQHPGATQPLEQRERETKERLHQSELSLKQGLLYAAQHNQQQAVQEFRHSAETDPANAFAWANLCGAYLTLNQAPNAEQACRRALTEDANNWLAHYNLGSLHAQRAQKDAAIQELSTALRIVAADRAQPVTPTAVAARLKTDQSFSQLRDDPRFLALLERP